MANIKSIGGNPIVVGLDGLTDDAKVTLLANRPSATLSGSIVTADDAAPTTPVDTTVYGQSTQDGTPTPSSPVPIVSVEGDASGNISLVACGRNLLDFASAASSSKQGVSMAPDADGWIAVSGTSTATSATLLTMLGSGSSDILPPGTYTMKVETSGTPFVASKVRLQVYGTDSTTENHYYDAAGTYTFTYDGPIHRIAVYMSSTSTNAEVDGRFRITLVSGTTAPTEYIPYVGTVTPIDLDGHELRSLPDGTRDELTVDAEGHVTLVQRVQLTTQAVTDGVTGTVGVDVMSSTGEIANGATVLYALDTPVTHDLGTVPLVPLVGPDLTAQTVPTAPFALTYERDATITIDRLTAMWANIAPVEGDTASASYSVGSYLMHGGQLCKVTTAIATGEAISIGTNVTTTTVMAEVIALTQ